MVPIHQGGLAPHQHEDGPVLSVGGSKSRLCCADFRACRLPQVTGFDVPHQFPDDYVPVFGMDPKTTVAYYNDRFKLCALLPCPWPAVRNHHSCRFIIGAMLL